MRILGIDPGTAKTGYSILEVNKKKTTKVITSDVIITSPDLEMHKRLRVLYIKLSEIVKEHVPDVMVVEKIFFNMNVKTAITVSQARGIVMLAAADADLIVYEYTSLEAKKLLTGYGRADKKQMQTAVAESLGLKNKVKSDDANDSIAIALCYIKKVYDLFD